MAKDTPSDRPPNPDDNGNNTYSNGINNHAPHRHGGGHIISCHINRSQQKPSRKNMEQWIGIPIGIDKPQDGSKGSYRKYDGNRDVPGYNTLPEEINKTKQKSSGSYLSERSTYCQ